MEFDSWNGLKRFYKQWLMTEPVIEVYFILDRDDVDRLVGFIEYYKKGNVGVKEFVGRLMFPHICHLQAFPFLGLTFYPCKKIIDVELEEEE